MLVRPRRYALRCEIQYSHVFLPEGGMLRFFLGPVHVRVAVGRVHELHARCAP